MLMENPAPQDKERHQLWGKPGFSIVYFNVTLFGRKAMSFLAGMDPDSKPDAIAMAEVHLRGTDLNVARRKVKQMGWRMLSTPAITKADLRAAAGEQRGKIPQLKRVGHPGEPFEGGDWVPSAERGIWLPQRLAQVPRMDTPSYHLLL